MRLQLMVMCVVLGALGIVRADPPGPVGSEENLIVVLKSDASLEAKADACRQLERVGTKDSVPALALLLLDEKLSHKARMALEQIKDPSVDEALRSALPKAQGRQLVGVIQSIGHRRDAASTDALIKLISDKDPDIASTAAYALGLIATPEAAKALESAVPKAPDETRSAMWDALLRVAETIDRSSSIALYDRLRASNAPAHIRAAAARGAVVSRGPEGLPLLADLLKDTDGAMFTIALRLVVELPGEVVTSCVAGQVLSLPPERQALLITALAVRNDKAALPAIRSALKSDDSAVRIAAINALTRMEDKPSLSAILQAANARDKSVADAAIAALMRLPGAEVDSALLEWVGGVDTTRSLLAIDCLSRRQSTSAGPALLKAATGGDAQVRLAALKALGDVGTSAEFKPLVGLMLQTVASPERDATEQTVIALCSTIPEKETCEQVILDTLTVATVGPEQKVALLRVLSSIGSGRALQAIRAAATDQNADIQETAIRTLCNWPTADVAPDLMQLAKTGPKPTHRILALRGWLRLAADARIPVEKRMEMCQQSVPLIQRTEEKRMLLAALASVPTLSSLDMISGYLDDTAVKEEASSATVAVAGALTNPPQPNLDSAKLIAPLEKVSKTSRNRNTVESANRVLSRLKQK